MLCAIFYARFHPERGPSVIHQYPRDSIIASGSSSDETLLSFSQISSYVIPAYELCNRPLSICTNGFRVLGFPVSLEDPKYERNRFTFNVCFVLKDHEDNVSWSKVVSKTAGFFQTIELEDGFLQAEEDLSDLKWAGDDDYPALNIGIVYTLLEAILEGLNTYGETCVRVDYHHILNLAILHSKSNPRKVRAWDVPLLIRSLPTSDEWAWDLTLQRIHSHVDGVNHVGRIAQLADVELKLVKKAVRELLYHDRVMILDIFHFQAIYTLKSDFSLLVKDDAMLDECAKYVARDYDGDAPPTDQSSSPTIGLPHKQDLVGLYRDLHAGISLQDFCSNHETRLANIDIRRFITYGVIKGFVRRIHKYALVIEPHLTPPRLSTSNGSTASRLKSSEDVQRELDRAYKRAAFSSGWANPPAEPSTRQNEDASQDAADTEIDVQLEDKLRGYLDGSHCMDEICVALRLSEKKVVERLLSGRFGNVVFFCK